MKSTMVMTIVWLGACGGGSGDDGIVDIGKPCSGADQCDEVCVVERGASVGQCSIACTDNSECPSFMDCIEGSSTGEMRCFDPGGLVVIPLDRQCEQTCDDVNYFCSDATIAEAETTQCIDFCRAATDPDREAFINCVGGEPRYTSACPAATCVLERI
jgi:hypothetical protein